MYVTEFCYHRVIQHVLINNTKQELYVRFVAAGDQNKYQGPDSI